MEPRTIARGSRLAGPATSAVRVSPSTLAGALGEWSAGPGPLYQQLADAIGAAVDRGDLPQGALLPSERVLAARLAVARGTVVAAYQALQHAGVVERRQGSGTRVVGGVAAPAVVRDLAAGVRAGRLSSRFLQPRDEVIDLGASLVPDAQDLPRGAFTVDLDQVVAMSGHGYLPLGLPALRARLAGWHRDQGLPTTAEQILVTLGGQQAIALTARLLVSAGDLVAIESPTFPGAVDSYARAGARFVTVPVDSGGLRVDDLARHLRADPERPRPRLVYTVPTHHNPTGAVMPEARRRALARLADDTGTWVVEDETLAPLGFAGPTPASVAAHSRGGTVLTVGSLSKVLWGGLRIGWLRGPAPVIERLGRLKAAHDLGSGAVSQVVALELLDHLDDVLALRRPRLAAQAAHLRARLAEALPEWQHRDPEGGLSLWIRLPDGASGDRFAAVAADHGVGVLPGSVAAADDTHQDHIRLTFAFDPEVLDEAVARLAAAWAAFRGDVPERGGRGRLPDGTTLRAAAPRTATG